MNLVRLLRSRRLSALIVLLLSDIFFVNFSPPTYALPPNFQDTVVWTGLTLPTAVRFAADGKVFVAEKSGIIKVYDGLADATPTVFADLQGEVLDYLDSGLLGLAVDPGFPARPYVYALYSVDAPPGVAPPYYHDTCNAENCPNFSRLLRLTADVSGTSVISQQVIRDGWCQATPLHSVGDLVFGGDGYLYVSHGEGGSPFFVDYGQTNTCADPPLEGGSLRAQDIHTSGDPVTYGGALIRINPDTGDAAPDNPLAGGSIADDDPIIAMGLRNPYRFSIDRTTGRIWIGDVGWNASEEVNTVSSPFTTVSNFGWPCFEGNSRQTGFESANLPICAGLYNSTEARAPYYAYSAGGGAAITGVALYRGSSFPAAYDGALFFADYVRGWIKVMAPGADGLPNPNAVTDFVPSGNSIVDMQVGPGGELFYVNISSGDIRRIAYISDNTPPVASVTADVTSGPLPLTVHFDASASHDPDPGDTISYAWDLDGDGVFDEAAGPTATFTYSSVATVSAGVRVTDSHGTLDTAAVAIVAGASAPLPTITAPTAITTYRVGSTIAFDGSAFDPNTTASMPATSLSWRVLLNHCAVANPTDCHEHFLQQFAGVAGGTVQAPDHEYPSFLRFELTVTTPASGGLPALTSTASRSIYPETTTVTLDTVPSGLQVSIYGTTATTPVTRTVIVNAQTTVTASTPQALAGSAYEFMSWSDGGTQTHLMTAPATPLTLTATYSAIGVPLQSIWNSWDVEIQSGGAPQALVTAPLTGSTATVEFYESTNDLGVLKGVLFSGFTPGIHPQTFNNLERYWGPGTGTVFPYAGKSNVNRGTDAGETNVPLPLGVRDLQLHPPNNAHNVVAAFRVPSDGNYTVSNLGVRRVSNLGGPVNFRVFNAQQVEIGTLRATANQAWVTLPASLTVPNLVAGSYLYFAVDNAGDYGYDAAEITWTVTFNGYTPPPPLPSCTLTALPTTVDAGMATTLTWTAINATSVAIDHGVGVVAPEGGGTVMTTPAGTTLYNATATGPGGSAACTTTVTVTADPNATPVWNSWDVVTQSGTPQGQVTASATSSTTTVDFYESTNDFGVVRGGLFSGFTLGEHPEAFNNLERYWGPGTGTVFPYAGKSNVNRGTDAGETNVPLPLGVRDLQLHPPNNAHNVVAAFRVPSDGNYTISGLGVRRVSNLGGPVNFHVYNAQQVEVATLQATANRAWVTLPTTQTAAHLTAGSYLYFAVDNAGDYGYDAAEIAWTVTFDGYTPPPPVPSCTLTALPTTVDAGMATSLTWTAINATSVAIDHGVGVVTPQDGGTVMTTPAGTTLYAATATGPGGSATCETTVTVTVDPNATPVWNSWDVVTQSGTPQGQVTASATGSTTTVDFYESTNNLGVVRGSLFGGFTSGIHPQTFNNLERYWGPGTGTVFPYAGKSNVNRGADAGETNVPMPLAVRDLQLHPPNNAHNVVAAFRVPSDGNYTVSNLGVRRVSNLGGPVNFRVFNAQQTEIATLQATANRAWVMLPTTLTAAHLTAGSYLYFAVDNAGDYGYDAAEITWTVIFNGYTPPPPLPSCTLTALPTTVDAGMATMLTWTAINATSVAIDHGVGVVTPQDGGTVMTTPAGTTLYAATATGPGGSATCETTVTVTVDPNATPVWNSWDVVTQSGTPQGQVTASATGSTTTVDFYESTNDFGVVRGGLFSGFTLGAHPETFNNLERYWGPGTGTVFPYAGKSRVNRGSDIGETAGGNTVPLPLGVRDLQLHPPNNQHNVVAAFRVPTNGTYTITNLGVRRVSNLGGPVNFHVYNAQQVEIATLQATANQAWVTSAAAYSLPNLTAGSYLYFAIDRAGDYGWDATEIVWSISRTGP